MTEPQVTVPVAWFERLAFISLKVEQGSCEPEILYGYIESAELIIKQEKTE